MIHTHRALPAAAVTLLVLYVTAGVPTAARGQTWNGPGTDWNTASNWINPSSVPNSASAVVNFTGNAVGTVNISSSVLAQSLNFSNSTGGYSLTSSSSVVLSDLTSITVAANVTGSQTINLTSVSTGNLLFADGSNLTIANNSNPSGTTLSIGSGTVIGTPGLGGVIFTGNGSTVFSGSFAPSTSSNNVEGGLTKSGQGVLDYQGNGSNLTGGITLAGGYLILDYYFNTASKLGGGALNLAGGMLYLYGSGTPVTQSISGGTSVSGGQTDVVTGTYGFVTLAAGAITRGPVGTVDFTVTPAPGFSPFLTVTTSTGNTNGLLGTGVAFATYNGGSTWATASGGAIAGLTTFGTNIYASGINTDVTTSAAVLGITTNSLRFNTGSPTLTLNSTCTLQSGGILQTPSSTGGTITGGAITAPNSGELLVFTYNTNDAFTINSALVSTVGLTKTGPGGLVLGGPNTGLTGPININRGGVVVTNPAAVNSASAINLNDARFTTVANAGFQYLTVDLGTGVNATITPPILVSMGGGNPGSFGTYFSTGNSSNSTITLAGVISSPAGLSTTICTTTGSGTDSSGFNLTNTNTFTGTILVGHGSLGINSSASLGNSANTLILDTGDSTAGGLVFLNSGITVVQPVVIFENTQVICNGSNSNTISSPITGGAGLVKAGTGTLTLSNPNNAFTGGLTVSAGTLTLGSTGALAGGSNVAVAAGAVFTPGTTNPLIAIGTVTLNGGTFQVSSGAGNSYLVNQIVTSSSGGTVNYTGAGTDYLVLTGTGAAITINGNSTWLSPGNSSALQTFVSSGGVPITIAAGVTLNNGIALQSLADFGYFIITGGGTLYQNSDATNVLAMSAPITVSQGSEFRVTDASSNGGLGNLGSGSFTLDGGTFSYGGSTAATSHAIVLTGNGGVIQVESAATALTVNNSVAGPGSLTKIGPGTLVLTSAADAFSSLSITAGTVQVAADNLLGSGPVTIGPLGTLDYTASTATARTFTLNGGAIQAAAGVTVTYSGPIGGGYLQGTGTHVLAAGSSLSGTTTFGAATVNQTGAGVTLSNFTNGGTFTNGASATWSGGLNQSTGQVNVNSTLTASNWGSSGIITVATTGNLNDTDATLILGGGSQTYVGSSSNPNTGGAITMTSGSTIALNGGLLINNGTIGAAGAGLVNINFGSLAKGAGNYAGGYSVNFGGTFQPGNSPGLVTSGASVWQSGGTFLFQINNATGSAGTNWGANNITGALTINATSTDPFTISVQSLTGSVPGQIINFNPTLSYQWTFIQTTGGISGFSPAAIAINTSGFANSFNGVFGVSENTGATSLYVTYTPATVSGTVHWSGAVSNAWDINTTQNWTAGGSPTTYMQTTNGGQAVVFDDTATGNLNVNLTTALSPSTVTVNSSVNTYTFSGTGKITGSASLVKTGTATLIVTTANDYTGGTTIAGGTLQVGDGTNSGALPGNTTNNASLIFMPGISGITVAGSIGGSGTIAIHGTNVVTFTGINSYSEGTTISGGTLNINSDSALGAAAGAVSLNGGTLQFAAAGGITLNSSRNVVLGGGSFDTNGGNDTISGVISGTSATSSNLIKNGAGSLSASNINTYAGSTIVNAGALTVLSGGSIGGSALVVGNPNTSLPATQSGLFLDNAAQTVGPLSGTIAQPGNGNTAVIFLSSSTTLTVNQTAPGTFQGTVFGSGNLVLGSSSANTLTLTGNSTYGGSTTISGGTLQLGVANALPATTSLTLSAGGTLNLNNNNQTIAALNSSAGNINTGSGTGGILTIGNTAGGTVTYSGVILGTGGVTWGIINTNVPNNTPSTLVLTNASTNTGPTTITTGTLSIGTAYALSNGVPPVLPYNAANTYPGAFTLGPTATLLTNGFNLTVGSLGGGGPIGGNINLGNNSGSTLYIVQSSATGYAGVISGTGNVYIVNGGNLAVYGNWTLTGGVTHDVSTLTGNHTDSPQSYLPFATSGSAVTTQGIEFAGFTDQVSTIYGGSAGDNNGHGTFVDATGDAGKLVLSYYAATVANGGPANGLGGTQNFSGFFANDVGLIVDAGYFGNAQQLTLSGPNNTTGPLTIGFTNQTTQQNGPAAGAQSGATNQVIISAASAFGAVTVGNLAVSNLVNNLTVLAGAGNLTAASVTIGDAFPGSTGNNSVTVGGTLTAGSVRIGNTNLYGTNVLTILSTGTVKAGGAITIGNDNATGTGTLNVGGALGTTGAPITSLSVQAGGVLAGYGTITAANAASNVINVTNGTIRGGFDDGVNQLGTLSIASSSGTASRAVLTIQGSGSSGLGQTGALMTEVLATSSTAATNSKINITGANNALSLITTSGGGSGQINIILYDPSASLTPGGPGGATYTFVLATVATAGRIQLGGLSARPGTPIDNGATLGAGTGSMGNADLYITGASTTYMNSVTSWSLFIDSTGKQLELSVTSATPEPEHIMLLCVGVLLAGFAVRRRRQLRVRGSEFRPSL